MGGVVPSRPPRSITHASSASRSAPASAACARRMATCPGGVGMLATTSVASRARGSSAIDHTRCSSVAELKEHGLQHLRDSVALLERKATPAEVDEYRQFVLNLADKVANAHREGPLGLSGERVSDAERAAITEIAGALGTPSPGA